ncbi:MAG: hypothetical protein JWN34_1561 [Bryobacterales bacterium]|nr:hypothetical protein [Bryobacterales bacterium]
MATPDRVGSEIQAQDKVRALEAALQSETFGRAGRLRDLLRFLCEAEIEGREADLSEYTIGTAVLGRGKDFAPLADSSVRSRTYELRQKLEKYYSDETPRGPVRIELRKGSYVPRFFVAKDEDTRAALPQQASGLFPVPPASPVVVTAQPADAPLTPPTVHRASDPRTTAFRTWLALAFFGGIATVLALTFAWKAVPRLAGRPVSADAGITRNLWTPELEAVWKPFIGSAVPTLLVVETRFFLQMGSLLVRDTDVNTLGHVEESVPLMRVKRLFGLQQLYEAPYYTDVGNPRAIFYLTRLLSTRIPDLAIKSSLETTADDFSSNNIILIGKPWLAPQVARTLEAAELVDARGKILNRHPRPGEKELYEDQTDPKDASRWSEKYSIISHLPGTGDGRRILTLTASGSEHPAALALYLTDPGTVRDLYRKMHLDSAKPNTSFQILVRVQFQGGSVVRVEYVTSRVLAL